MNEQSLEKLKHIFPAGTGIIKDTWNKRYNIYI